MNSLVNRGIIIRSIQQQLQSPLTRQKAELQDAAFNILKGTTGTELTLLKEDINNAEHLLHHHHQQQQQHLLHHPVNVNTKEDVFQGGDLHQLIYGCKDLTSVVSVMQHIAVEALKVETLQRSKDGPLIKIISDIDDTLFPGYEGPNDMWILHGRIYLIE
jgi:hypothetical protein